MTEQIWQASLAKQKDGIMREERTELDIKISIRKTHPLQASRGPDNVKTNIPISNKFQNPLTKYIQQSQYLNAQSGHALNSHILPKLHNPSISKLHQLNLNPNQTHLDIKRFELLPYCFPLCQRFGSFLYKKKKQERKIKQLLNFWLQHFMLST